MERPLLNDPEVKPSEEVIKSVLGISYDAYSELIKTITGAGYGITPQWNYYRDGRSWLCKACYKNKTIFWLSVWQGYFKTTFYFTDKNSNGFTDLTINNSIIEEFISGKHIGKLIPVTISVNGNEQVNDIIKIISFKKDNK